MNLKKKRPAKVGDELQSAHNFFSFLLKTFSNSHQFPLHDFTKIPAFAGIFSSLSE